MSKVIRAEHPSDDVDLKKDQYQANFFSEPKSVFFTAQGKPFCKLLILGDFEVSDNSKKKELFASSSLEKLKINQRQNNLVSLGEQNNGVSLFISDYCYYDKFSSPPACLGATMTVIIPNSDQDLQTCFNSVFNRSHQPAKDSKVVYINLFDPNTENYRAIELKAKELNFSKNKLVLEPNTFDSLIDIALQHTKEIFDYLSQPKNLTASQSASQVSSSEPSSCTIL